MTFRDDAVLRQPAAQELAAPAAGAAAAKANWRGFGIVAAALAASGGRLSGDAGVLAPALAAAQRYRAITPGMGDKVVISLGASIFASAAGRASVYLRTSPGAPATRMSAP